MSEKTGISWTDHTWSPVWGCTQVSKAETGGGGCDNCYAMTLAHRFGYGWNGKPMREFGEHHWNEPVRWNRRAAKAGTRPTVFPSMCDPLDKDWPDGVRERFWRLVDATPYLTWLILTKRIGNYDRFGPGVVIGRNPANVWIGATVVNQEEADRDVPKLLQVPARVRFLSIEPMLGPIDFYKTSESMGTTPRGHPWANGPILGGIHWVIAGGESGPHARPAHPDWFRSLRAQCQAAGVPFHFKQFGEWAPGSGFHKAGPVAWIDHTGRVVHEGNDFPKGSESADNWTAVHRLGTKLAGRLLDGVEHNSFPGAQ